MEVEKGVMAAVINQKGRALVLRRKKNWEGWELVKGGLETTHNETVLIELEEEAGIPSELVDSVKNLGFEVEWEYSRDGNDYKKKYQAYAVRVSDDANVDVTGNPCDEHEHGFFFNIDHAREMLEYEDSKKVLDEASKEFGID